MDHLDQFSIDLFVHTIIWKNERFKGFYFLPCLYFEREAIGEVLIFGSERGNLLVSLEFISRLRAGDHSDRIYNKQLIRLVPANLVRDCERGFVFKSNLCKIRSTLTTTQEKEMWVRFGKYTDLGLFK